jgi:cellulose synthase/poly-beta-1,6-N-acetylglucosamine synthase-like glycosyltransferase
VTPAPARRFRRQWGTERRTGAAPVMHRVPTRRAMSAARFALFFTLTAWLVYFVEQMRRYLDEPVSAWRTAETATYLVLVTLLTCSASAYLLTRLGALQRVRAHRRTPRYVIDATFDESNPTMTVIVPSYREERKVVRQTLLTTALQEYPSLRVVLLIDDPPDPADPRHARMLEEARSLPGEVAALLEAPRGRFEAALDAFEGAVVADGPVEVADLEILAGHYDEAVAWLRGLADGEEVADHVDAFMVDEVVMGLARDLTQVAAALREARGAGAEISAGRVRHLYRRLVWIFRADMSSFERKRFASLSHEPNKAMNLNSYIGLMGGRYRVRDTAGGRILLPVRAGAHDLEVPDPDYVLTLDADSMLLPEYCLRLVHHMEQPEHADVGVVQTPYSAYRGAPTRLERLAGATTDLQHLVHQGLTRYDATFWVGANAVLRKSALDDVVVEEDHAGFRIRRYIQDRTPIEDTESSLDLRLHGWRLMNYPERLSYSATPPDLGALAVQRQRWANGGLVMLPSLWRLTRARSRGRRRAMAMEAFLRLNYLASIAWASLGLWLLLFYPFDQRLLSSWAILTAVPYFIAMSTDLRRTGYRRLDVLRLYGFNIMLLAVNTAGVVKSIAQAIGGQKMAFARTPKVKRRTITPVTFVLMPFVIAGWSAFTLASDVGAQRWMHAAFAGINAALTLWVMLSLHGVRNTVGDVVYGVRERLYRRERRTAAPQEGPGWVHVLYHGAMAEGERRDGAAVAEALAAVDQEGPADRQIVLADGPAPAVRPTPPADGGGTLAPADVEVLARALAERIGTLRPGGTIVLRMTDGALHLGADDDAPAEARRGGPFTGRED